jgi:hypothetical protein
MQAAENQSERDPPPPGRYLPPRAELQRPQLRTQNIGRARLSGAAVLPLTRVTRRLRAGFYEDRPTREAI